MKYFLLLTFLFSFLNNSIAHGPRCDSFYVGETCITLCNVNFISPGVDEYLIPTLHEFTFTNAQGCDSVIKFGLVELPLGTSIDDGRENGSIALTFSAGISPFAYKWKKGAITQLLSGLTTSKYHLPATSDNNTSLEEFFCLII